MSESEDDLFSIKTRSLVFMEHNLVSSCDVSPIQPKQLREAENLNLGVQMEKLLLERVMLRKELKLRNMQKRLLDQTQKLEEAMIRLAEYENLPGISKLKAIIKIARKLVGMVETVICSLESALFRSLTGIYQVT
jgi:hypothetical protein